jgi:tetratricopeptide (TPR) repeat protein
LKEYPEVKHHLALVEMHQQNNPQRAFELLNELVNDINAKRHPFELGDNVKSLVLAHRAKSLFMLKRTQESKTDALESVKLFSQNEAEAILLVNIFEKDLDFQKTLLEEALQINPISTPYLAKLSQVLLEQKNILESLEKIDNAISLDKNNDELISAKGLIFYKQKNYERALQLFYEASIFSPNDASHYYNMACMLSLLGKYEGSFLNLKKSVYLDEKLKDAIFSDADLLPLLSSEKFGKSVKNLVELSGKEEENFVVEEIEEL